ncbi:MAG: hypothetical protein ACXWQ5_19700 [Ktedonobacterales bacterium]
MHRYTPGRLALIAIIVIALMGVTWGILFFAVPQTLPQLLREKSFFLPLLILTGYILLADALALDIYQADKTPDGVNTPAGVLRFLDVAMKVTGTATFVLVGAGLLMIAQRPEWGSILLVILFGGSGLTLAFFNCLLYYWYSKPLDERLRLRGAPSGQMAPPDSRSQPQLNRASHRTIGLSPLQRRSWLAACLVVLALPLLAFTLVMLYPSNSDVVAIAGIIAFFGGGGDLGLILWAPIPTPRTRRRQS